MWLTVLSIDKIQPQTCQTKVVLKHDSSNIFSVICLLVSQKPDQPAYLSTNRPPIIDRREKADCNNRQNTSVIMSKQQQQQPVDSSWVEGFRGAFPKTHMEAISVAVRTGTFPSPPPHSLYSSLGCTTTV